jgi:hypothetical protein
MAGINHSLETPSEWLHLALAGASATNLALAGAARNLRGASYELMLLSAVPNTEQRAAAVALIRRYYGI